MPSFNIALLPGDGVGPEVVDATCQVLNAVLDRLDGLALSYETLSVGAVEYLANGDPLPDATVEKLKTYDAILLGAMGLPEVRWPNGVEMTPQIDIREKLDLYQGVRPIKLYHPEHSPLQVAQDRTIDFVIMRENCEGLFSTRLADLGDIRDVATDTMTITRHGAKRICRAAFKIAKDRRQKVTLVDKANVLQSMAFLRNVFNEVATDYPDIETECVYVDAMALFLVQDPFRFDVIVTENMFGDILSDQAAGLVGGMGMAPSADIGDDYAVFQPSHGSAPTIAGKGIANPVATILSGALMLRWLDDNQGEAGARLIENAVSQSLLDLENRTVDLGGSLSTSAMTKRIIAKL